MTALSALAEYPRRVENLFLNRELSKTGVYAVNLYALNVPITIQVDDWLPLRSNMRDAIFAKIPEDGSLWGPIIEKAFAKFHGNYARIEEGWQSDGVNTLNGSPSFDIDNGSETLDHIWNTLQTYDMNDNKALITAGTTTGGMGIAGGHAYTTLAVATLRDGTRLVKLRNPWGTEKWRGDYSDTSSLMT